MNTLKSLFNEYKKTEMTPEEKSHLWSAIEVQTFNAPAKDKTPSYFASTQEVFSKKRKYVLSLFVGSAILCGGISAYAQNTLPGNIFHPIKTQVIEKLQRAIAFTSETKVTVEADIAYERLLEIERLAAQGNLTEEVVLQNTLSFEKQVSRLENELHTLQINNKYDTAFLLTQNFRSKLLVHAALLKTLETNSPEKFPKSEVPILIDSILFYTNAFAGDKNATSSMNRVDTTTAATYTQSVKKPLKIMNEVTIVLTPTPTMTTSTTTSSHSSKSDTTIPTSTTTSGMLDDLLKSSIQATSSTSSSVDVSSSTKPSSPSHIPKEVITPIEKTIQQAVERLPTP